LHLNTECSQTDGQKEKSITIYLAVHSVHLADIITTPPACADWFVRVQGQARYCSKHC